MPIIQTKIDTITIEFARRGTIPADEKERLEKLMAIAADPAFKLDVRLVDKIDWSENPKRLFFRSSVA